MSQAAIYSLPTGCRPTMQGGTPSPLPPGAERGRARDHRVRRGGRAGRRARRRPAGRRARARRGGPPTTSTWIRGRAGAGGRGRRPVPPGRRAAGRADPRRDPRAGAAPDRGQRARRRASWPRCSACSRAARLVHADLRRVAEPAPLRRRAAATAARQGDRAPAGAVASTPTATCSTRPVPGSPPRGARCRPPGNACSAGWRRCSAGSDPSAAPADASVTVRGNRYVIPVRRDSRSRPPGIIHDESGSAGTLFIEPSEAIELGNALREAEVEEERETLRVLRELTDLLRPELPCSVTRSRCAWRWTIWSPGRATPSRWRARCPRSRRAPADAPDRERPPPAAAGRGADRWCRSISSCDRRSAPCSSAAPTPAARRCCSRPSAWRRRWRERHHPAGRRGEPAAHLPAILRRHRRPAVHRGEPLHLQRRMSHAAARCWRRRTMRSSCCWTRSAAAPIRSRARRSRGHAGLAHRRGSVTLATTHLGALKELASGTGGS